MKYPAIYGNGVGCNILWFNENKGVSLDDGCLVCKESTSKVANITQEYLSNTWGVVESKEHAEFIVELAEGCGFEQRTGLEKKYFCYDGKYLWFTAFERYALNKNRKQINTNIAVFSITAQLSLCSEHNFFLV